MPMPTMSCVAPMYCAYFCRTSDSVRPSMPTPTMLLCGPEHLPLGTAERRRNAAEQRRVHLAFRAGLPRTCVAVDSADPDERRDDGELEIDPPGRSCAGNRYRQHVCLSAACAAWRATVRFDAPGRSCACSVRGSAIAFACAALQTGYHWLPPATTTRTLSRVVGGDGEPRRWRSDGDSLTTAPTPAAPPPPCRTEGERSRRLGVVRPPVP